MSNSNSKTYIIIELDESENAGDIMNVLITKGAQFTVTKDIQKYAAERAGFQIKNEDRKRVAESVEPVQPEKVEKVPEFENVHEIMPTTVDRQDHLGYDPFIQNKLREYSNNTPPSHKRAKTAPSDVEPIINLDDDSEVKPSHLAILRQMEGESNMYFDNNSDLYQAMSSYDHNGMNMSDSNYMSTEPETTTSTSRINKRPIEAFQCQRCGAMIKTRGMDFFKRSAHAIIHTEVLRYKCPVENCSFKNRHRADCVRHLKVVHKMEPHSVKIEDCMTEPEKAVLRKMVFKCFPEVAKHKAEKYKENLDDMNDDEEEEEFDLLSNINTEPK